MSAKTDTSQKCRWGACEGRIPKGGGKCSACGEYTPKRPVPSMHYQVRVNCNTGEGEILATFHTEVRYLQEWISLAAKPSKEERERLCADKLEAYYYSRPRSASNIGRAVIEAAAKRFPLIIIAFEE